MTIKEYIIQNGKQGVEKCEKIVCVPFPSIRTTIIVEEGTPFKRKKRVAVSQMCYFADTDEVQAYCIDTDDNGWFCEWDKLSKSARYKICNALLQFD